MLLVPATPVVTVSKTPEARPVVHLMRGVVGSGKTEVLIDVNGETQRLLLEIGKVGQIVGFTPRHDLNNQVAKRWEAHNGTLTAATIMGRLSKDPADAKEGKEVDPNWCRYTELVRTATDYGQPIKKTCCIYRDKEGKETKCNFFERCGNQMQYETARQADLVLMPHALLTHQQTAQSDADVAAALILVKVNAS
jgi:hypothetical protein